MDSSTLIKKLARSGKHAELWPRKSTNQSNRPTHPQHQQQHQAKDGKNKKNKGQGDQALIQGLKAFKNQHSTADFFSSDDEDWEGDDLDDEEDEDDELGLDLLKLKLPNNAAAAAAGAKKTLHIAGNGNKRPTGETYPNRPTGSKYSNVPQAKGLNAAQPNNRMANNGLMGLAALQGRGLQTQHQLGANFSTGFPASGNHQTPLMVNLQGQPSSTMTNLRAMNNNAMANINNSSMLMNESRFVQPQVMYNRSPHIPPYTGYYYPSPYYQSLYYNHHPETGGGAGHGDHHPFSDECSSGCVVM